MSNSEVKKSFYWQQKSHKFIFEPTMFVWKYIWEQRKKYVNDINQSSKKLSHHTFIFTSKNKKKSFFSFISHLPFYIYVQKSIYIQNSLEKLLSNSFTSLLAPICSQFSSSSLCWIPQQQKKGRRQRGFDEYSEFVYGQFQIYPFKHVLITFRSPKIPPA